MTFLSIIFSIPFDTIKVHFFAFGPGRLSLPKQTVQTPDEMNSGVSSGSTLFVENQKKELNKK